MPTGGATVVGGATTGGAASGGIATGGTLVTDPTRGGSATTGGSPAITSTGGTTPTNGGSLGAGGRSKGGAPTGGAATGGAPTGGAATGGAPAGGAATGGAATGGAVSQPGGGRSAGGRGAGGSVTNTGGSPVAGNTSGGGDAVKSAGCGKAPPAATTARQTIDVSGSSREYILVYPTSYDPNHPYRLMFEFHGSGGTAEENIRFQWYGVQPLSGNSMIFVAPQGLGSPAGWPNTGGQDVAFTRALLTFITNNLCVDTSRIFVTGFSYGAMFTNTLGCQMGDVFRAIAPASGGGPNGNCIGKPAAVVIHGSADTTVNVSSGIASRDHWLGANHCGATTVAMEPSPCVVYQGCDPGTPVAWCEHAQGHMILSSFFGPAIWNFFSQF